LISLASEAVAENEIAPLRNYVAAGGMLFVGSSGFTRNPDGTTRGDFALASEMGLHMVNLNSLQNWYLNLHFTKIGDHRLTADIPSGSLTWRMPLSSEEIPLGASPSHGLHGSHHVFSVSSASDTIVIANGDLGPLLATKSYGQGNFIYHGAAQPLIGHSVYDPSMYAYLIYRRAIEWAFEAHNLPIIKLSPWRYEYNAAFLVRHDFENDANSIRAIENSASFEFSHGVKGDYYFCTGTLRENMSDKYTVIESLQRAVASYGATIGPHNGGLKNPVNASLSTSDFDYWHWGPDEALDVTPPGYASGKAYAQESISLSFQDIESWLAGLDNGRPGCGSVGNCPRIWASPYMNSTRESSYSILEELSAVSMGEQKIGPFPGWTLSTQTDGKRYNHISIPTSDWYVGGEVPGAIEWGHTTDTMQEAVDFYYNIGAPINLYGHIASNNSTLIGQYINYCLTKPRMWATNSVEISDWWRARSNTVITPSYNVTGTTAVAQATIAGATDPDTTVEVAIPSGDISDFEVFVDGELANPADYRTVGNMVKVRVGASTSSATVQYTITASDNPVPATTSLSPSSATAGDAGFTLTVNGSGFVSDSVVQWNGASRTTTYVSATQLTAAIPATDIAAAGTASVTVFNPAPGGGTSNAQSFTITASDNPVPATTSLSPSSATAGDAGFTLTVNGSGFVSDSVVQWNGASRTTTYVSATQLTAAIPATDIAAAGTASVTVFNPAPGGGTSNAQSFTITASGNGNPVPATTSLSPSSATAGDAGFTLTVNGSGFVSDSVVQWNGASRTTTYVSATQLTAAILATDIAAAGTASVTVFNPAPGGGTSNAQSLTIVTQNVLFSDDFTRQPDDPAPLSPWIASMGTWAVSGGVLQGSGNSNQYSYAYTGTSQWTDYTVQGRVQMPTGSFGGGIGGRLDSATGAHYGAWVYPAGSGGGSNVLKLWKFQGWTDIGAGVPMQQVNLPEVGTGWHTLQITFSGNRILVYYDETLMIDVTDNNYGSQPPYLSGGISADWWTGAPARAISVDDISVVIPSDIPIINNLSPSSATAGDAGFTLTVNGSGFVSDSVVQWNGASRTTTYVSATQLTAAIPATDIAAAGTASVTVFNPAPGGGTSNAQSFTITASDNPVPATTSLSPSSATAGDAGFTLTVNGSGFVSDSVVQWNGASRTTTYVSATQLTAAIPATDIAAAGTASVTVFNPAPGGGTSNAQSFTITASGNGNPVPATTSLSPSSATAGDAGFTLTVNGSGFVSDSVVQWNGASRTTTYVSATQLTAAILATDIAAAGTASVTVFNPAPGGGTSNAQSLTIVTQNVLFSDDFTRQPDDPAPLSPWIASMGTWAVSGGVLQGSGNSNQYSYAYTGTSQWTDYTVQGRVQMPTGSFGGGIGGRLDSATGAHYGAWVYPAGSGGGSNVLKLWKFQGWTDIGAGVPMQQVNLPEVGTGWHTLQITFSGNRILVYYDETLMIDVTDNNYGSQPPYLSGGISADWWTGAPARAISVDDISVVIPSDIPIINNLSPSSATAGDAGFTLTVNGSGFVSDSVVQWNGASRTTTYVSATQLTAAIPATDIAAAGTASVTVFNPAPGGGTSNAQSFTITASDNPVPATTSLSPSSATAGDAGFTLTVNGSGFVSDSVVQWNGASRTTTYVSATQLTAAIPATDIAAAGTASVTVFNPAPGGGTSNAQSFTITASGNGNPVPATTSLSPSSATAGDAGFTLTVNGSGFVSDSVVQWNGASRTTTYVSATQLTAAIPATDIAAAGTASVTVFNPAPGGGTSNAQSFTITASDNPVPATTSLSPSSATAGDAGFTLTVNGSGFVSDSVVQWNGASRTTTYVSATQLTAAIPATDIAAAGTASVTVFNPAPGGGTSNAQSFTITASGNGNPVPATTSLSPSSATAGDAGFTLTVNGSGFVSDSVVQWNGASRTTTYVSATQLTAAILATDIAAAGTASVTVFNPAPGGGTSNAQSLTIVTQNVLFSDDFTRQPDDPAPLSPWIASMGTWAVSGGVLQGSGNSNQYSYAYTGTSQWTDYTVQGRVQMPTGSFGGGIGGRLDSATGAHYGAWVYPAGSGGGSNVLKLWKFQGWTDIGAGVPMQQVNLPEVGTGWHTLQITFSGNRILVYYDETLMIDVTDNNYGSQPPYLSGGISADWWTGALPYTVVVDDIVVVTQ
jgi:hypothetical protein